MTFWGVGGGGGQGTMPGAVLHLRASRLRSEGHGRALGLSRRERLASSTSAGLHADADDAGDGHVLLGVPPEHRKAGAYPPDRGREAQAARAAAAAPAALSRPRANRGAHGGRPPRAATQ